MTSTEGAPEHADGGQIESAWQDELPEGASQLARLRRIEEIARDYHLQVADATDLVAQVASLTITGASIDTSLNRLDASVVRAEQTRKYLTRVLTGVIIGTSVLILGVILATAYFLQERLDTQQFRDGSIALCEQRDRQAAAIRLFAELEIERTRESTILNAEQRAERISVLETLSQGFPDEDCSVIK